MKNKLVLLRVDFIREVESNLKWVTAWTKENAISYAKSKGWKTDRIYDDEYCFCFIQRDESDFEGEIHPFGNKDAIVEWRAKLRG